MSDRSLLRKKLNASKSLWFADGADFFVLLTSFLLLVASIVLVALIFYTRTKFERYGAPHNTLSILQRAISALSTTVTSAMIMVAGKRYGLFKFARGGIRSRRVALYSNPSTGNLALYLVRNGLELPLLVLSAVWALGLATGLTVSDAWAMVPAMQLLVVSIPGFGPFDAQVVPGSLSLMASGQLSYLMASLCAGVAGSNGLINARGGTQLTSGGPTGIVFYPPLLDSLADTVFSLSTRLNGFNITVESLSSIPSTAQGLTCVDGLKDDYTTGQLWYEGGDNQTLSIIANFTYPNLHSLYRFNATAIGTPNGTTWPNVMNSDRWAQDIALLVCNVSCPCASVSSLLDFAFVYNPQYSYPSPLPETDTRLAGIVGSTALGMTMGAYSSALNVSITPGVFATRDDVLLFTPHYGVYVLIANIVVSAVMLTVVVKLRTTNRLGADFLNATRLLLDPLKNPELFNASLDTTVDTLENPYMLVREDSEFLLSEQVLSEETR